tara:strand:- start:1122 stop:3611 length:2490 start_codon:yes stop_codon:yes gene_type:complete
MAQQDTIFSTKVGYKADQYDLNPTKGARTPDTSAQAAQPFKVQMEASQLQFELNKVARDLDNQIALNEAASKTPEETFLSKLAPFSDTINSVIDGIQKRRLDDRRKEAQSAAADAARFAMEFGGGYADLRNAGDAIDKLADKAAKEGKDYQVIARLQDLDPEQQHWAAKYLQEQSDKSFKSGLETFLQSDQQVTLPNGAVILPRQANTKAEAAAVIDAYTRSFLSRSGIDRMPIELQSVAKQKIATHASDALSKRNLQINKQQGAASKSQILNATIGGMSLAKAARMYGRLPDEETGFAIGLGRGWEKLTNDLYQRIKEGGIPEEVLLKMEQEMGIQDPNRLLSDPKEKGWVFDKLWKGMREYNKQQVSISEFDIAREGDVKHAEFLQIYPSDGTGDIPSEATLTALKQDAEDRGIKPTHKYIRLLDRWSNGNSMDDIAIDREVQTLRMRAANGHPIDPLTVSPQAYSQVKDLLDGPTGNNTLRKLAGSKEALTSVKTFLNSGTNPGDGNGLALKLNMLGKSESATGDILAGEAEKIYYEQLKILEQDNPKSPNNPKQAAQLTMDIITSGAKSQNSVFYWNQSGMDEADKFPNAFKLTGEAGEVLSSNYTIGPTVTPWARLQRQKHDLKVRAAKAGNWGVLFKEGEWQKWTSVEALQQAEQALIRGAKIPDGTGLDMVASILPRQNGKTVTILQVYDHIAKSTGLVQPIEQIATVNPNNTFAADQAVLTRMGNIQSTKGRERAAGYYTAPRTVTDGTDQATMDGAAGGPEGSMAEWLGQPDAPMALESFFQTPEAYEQEKFLAAVQLMIQKFGEDAVRAAIEAKGGQLL